MDSTLREKILSKIIFLGFGFSGAAALMYEVVWTRSLSTIMGSSTYAVSTMLAAFMAGLSAGGWFGAALAPRVKRLNIAFALCELGIGLTGLITIPAIVALTPLYIKFFYSFHLSFNTFSLIQFGIIFMIMGIPTTLMGMTFPLVVKLFAKGDTDVGTQAGYLYGINTLGAIAGSTIAGFLLIPTLGVKGSAIAAASLNIATALTILLLSRNMKSLILGSIAIVGLSIPAILTKPAFPFFSFYNASHFGSYDMARKVYDRISQPGNQRILYHREGVESDVALIEYNLHGAETEMALTNNGKREAGDDIGFALLAYLPYLLHSSGAPQTALNIGLGSGNTLAHLARFPWQHIDSVELSKGILEVNRQFLKPALFQDQRISHIKADGRNFLLLNKNHYDLIIASPSWAVEQASASLFTDEFFALAENRLADNGVFAVWVDFFIMSYDDMKIIARTLARHFQHSIAWYIEGDFVVMVASNSPFGMTTQEVFNSIHVDYPRMQGKFSLAMTEEQITALPPGLINTDDKPIIEFTNARHLITWETN